MTVQDCVLLLRHRNNSQMPGLGQPNMNSEPLHEFRITNQSCNTLAFLLNVRGEVHPRTRYEGPQVEQRYISTLSLTLALDGGGWLTPRLSRFDPGEETRYPLCRRLSGPPSWSGRKRKSCTHLDFFVFSYTRCLLHPYLFVLIVLHFAFVSLVTTQNTNIHSPGGGDLNPQPQKAMGRRPLALDRSATEIDGFRSPDRPVRSQSLYQLSYPGPLKVFYQTDVSGKVCRSHTRTENQWSLYFPSEGR